MPLRLFIVSSLLAFLMSSCSKPVDFGNAAGSSMAQDNRTKDDIEELRNIIELPDDAEEAVWREEVLSAAAAARAGKKEGTSRLVAVLRFEGRSAERFDLRIRSIGKGERVSLATESWFPAELVAKGQTDSQEMISAMSFPATSFAKAPYADGRIMRAEGTSYYVLELFAK